MRGSSRLLIFSCFFFVFFIEVSALKTHIIYWNASNPLFRRGDYEINVRLGDQIKIICPQVKNMEDDDGAYLIINKDSEMAHMNCVLENPRQVAVCNNPREPLSLTTTVRKYRMSHLGIELEPGMTHYFLSTSRGSRDIDGMNKKMEGMCKHDHMRMKIVVDELDPVAVIDSTRSLPTSTPRRPSSKPYSIPQSSTEEEKKERVHHEPRRHTKKEKEHHEDMPVLGKYSESDMPALYNYNTASEESPDRIPSSRWDAVKMTADEVGGEIRSYNYPDYIISERSSSASFSFFLLSIILVLLLR